MATITTTELATELGTDTRTARKFLRSNDSGIGSVGKGSRYSIEKREVRALKSRFAKWTAAQATPEAPEGTDDSTDD